MALKIALVLEGDSSGAKKALEETATGVETLGRKADSAAGPINEVGGGLAETAKQAPEAAAGVVKVGDAADAAGGKFGSLKTLALGAIGGIAAGFAAAGLAALFSAATGAFAGFVQSIVSGRPQIEAALIEHEALIKRVKGAYEGASDAASTYGANSLAFLNFEGQQNITELRDAFERQQRDMLTGRDDGIAGLIPGAGLLGVGETFGRDALGSPFEKQVRDFRAELRAGEADAIAFRDRVAEIAQALPLDDPARSIADQLLGDTAVLAELQTQFLQAIDLYRGLTGEAEAMTAALGGSNEQWVEQRAQLEAARENVSDLADEYDRLNAVMDGAGPTPTGGGFDLSFLWPFATGGYTGDGDIAAPAGVVHGKEFVVNAGATARNRGLLEAINSGLPGYANGGFVAPVPPPRPGIGQTGQTGAMASEFAALLDIARGALGGFSAKLDETGDVMAALGGVVKDAAVRFAEFFLDRALFGANGDGGLMGALLGAILPSQMGNAFSGGQVIPFADGGVISGPTLFPLGLAGEAGPEAILPLQRGSDGRLGVSAANGNSAGSGSVVNNFYIDAKGAEIGVEDRIVRAIKAQVPAMITAGAPAAVASAQRNRRFG
jgi:hypothetical protein